MFEFTTQTVFNSIIKATETQVREKNATKGYNVITKDTAKGPEVRIGNTRFNKENVLDIQIKNHTPENLAKVEFDLANVFTLVEAAKEGAVKEGSYRIVLYIGLSMNSQDSFYANDLVYKGKPLFIEFPVNKGDTAEIAAKRAVKIANKYQLFTAQEKILDITANEGKITIEGVNGYQIIKQAVIQKYDEEANPIDCCIASGDFIDIVKGVPVIWTTDNDGVVTIGEQTLEDGTLRDLTDYEVAIEPGLEAFGDYNWLIHNLRLPTMANTYFWSPTKNEMPIVGGEYTQFIIRMCVERDGIAGEVVGQRATSVTTHVLYVLDQGTNVADVKNVLAPLVNGVANIKTDADDVLKEPYSEVTE